MFFKELFKNFQKVLPIITVSQIKTENILVVSNFYLQFILLFLKKHVTYQFNLLSCISGVDLLAVNYRFCVVYDLLSIVFNTRLRIKVYIDNLGSVQSIINIFKNANWWEREVWDMFGIYFSNHTDLRRILSDYGFEGYAMRKDFPLTGFVELHYCETKKRVVIEPVSLAQEYRTFTFDLPW